VSAEAETWAWQQPVTVRQKLILLAIAQWVDARARWAEDLHSLSDFTGIGTAACVKALEELKECGILHDMANSGFIRLQIAPRGAQIQEEIVAPEKRRTVVTVKAQIESVFAAYCIAHDSFFRGRNAQGPPQPKLNPTRRKRLAVAIREYDYETVILAGIGVFFSEFHTGGNNGGQLYLRPEHVWRMKDSDNIERFAELARNKWRAIPQGMREQIESTTGIKP